MDDSVDVVELAGEAAGGPDRAVVRMHGPLGIAAPRGPATEAGASGGRVQREAKDR